MGRPYLPSVACRSGSSVLFGGYVLTPDKQRTILALLRDGNSRRVAVRCAGYSSENTYDYWVKQAALGAEPYASFLPLMDQAEAEAESGLVNLVRMAAIEDAKHAQWMLERRFKWWTPRDSMPVAMQAVSPAPATVSDADIEASLRDKG